MFCAKPRLNIFEHVVDSEHSISNLVVEVEVV